MKNSASKSYLDAAIELLQQISEHQSGAIHAAAQACSEAVAAGGLIYILGTGHSHLMAEEAHFRAGGLACVVPILSTPLMLHEGAVVSMQLERMPGLARILLSRYPISSKDVLIVYSSSGVNSVPVEAARCGKEIGAHVIGITSLPYSTAIANERTRLADIADTVIDTGAPAGDALVPIENEVRAGPVSTVLGAALLNALVVQIAANLVGNGQMAPVYLSGNMPGSSEHNQKLVNFYRPLNPHL